MNRDLVYKVASAYYRDNLSQDVISGRYGISRIKVSRLLKKAREEGVVQISIRPPADSRTELERELATSWDLDEIILTDTLEDERKMFESAGIETWKYFKRVLKSGNTVGLSWGTALSAFVDAAERTELTDIRIVQLVGGLGSPEAETHSSGLVLRMAGKLNGVGRILPAPGIVGSESVRSALYGDPEILRTLRFGADADIAVVGIGRFAPGLLPESDYEKLNSVGAAGDIAFQFFSEDGEDLNELMSGRIVGIERGHLKRIPRVIGIAVGKEKRRAIVGALRTGLLNVLVTDRETGEYLKNAVVLQEEL